MAGHYEDCLDPTDCWCEVKRLFRVLWVTLLILILEIGGGLYSGSLALLADAGHVFGDSTAIVVNIIAALLVKFNARTKRVRDAAFRINIGLLFLVAGWIMFEAIERLENPGEVLGPVMVVVAFMGGVGNFIQQRILAAAAAEHKHHAHRALSLHVLSDLMQSVAVVIGGIIIWIGGWNFIDPVLSIGIAAWIVYQAIRLSLNPNGHGHGQQPRT